MARIGIESCFLGGILTTNAADALVHIEQDGTAGDLEDKFCTFDREVVNARLLYGDHLPRKVINHLRAPLLGVLGNQWRDVVRARTLAREKA